MTNEKVDGWLQWELWCLRACEWDVSYFHEWCDVEIPPPLKLKTLFDYE